MSLLATTANAEAQSASSVRHVNAVEASALISQTESIVVLDVRTPWEFKRGHINGAININYFGFGFSKAIAALDPDTTYLVHCKSGHRSTRSLKAFEQAGITNVIHLDGGIDQWKKAELPLQQ